jgi:hypothetical protein
MNIQEIILGTGLVIATNGPTVQNAGPYYGGRWEEYVRQGALPIESPAIVTNYPVIRLFADQPYPWNTLETYPGPFTKGDYSWQSFPTGTPIEGSELVTETRELEPCFAAVYPACPGHWKTNRMTWVYHAGNWSRKAENQYKFYLPPNGGRIYDYGEPWKGSPVVTNTISTNLLQSTVATNFGQPPFGEFYGVWQTYPRPFTNTSTFGWALSETNVYGKTVITNSLRSTITTNWIGVTSDGRVVGKGAE